MKVQFRLRTLLAVTALVAIACELWVCLGDHGVALFLDGLVVAALYANLRGHPRLLGITVPRMALLEFYVLAVICVVLHGFCMPPVLSKGHVRGAANVPQPTTPAPNLPALKPLLSNEGPPVPSSPRPEGACFRPAQGNALRNMSPENVLRPNGPTLLLANGRAVGPSSVPRMRSVPQGVFPGLGEWAPRWGDWRSQLGRSHKR